MSEPLAECAYQVLLVSTGYVGFQVTGMGTEHLSVIFAQTKRYCERTTFLLKPFPMVSLENLFIDSSHFIEDA